MRMMRRKAAHLPYAAALLARLPRCSALGVAVEPLGGAGAQHPAQRVGRAQRQLQPRDQRHLPAVTSSG